MVEGLTATAPYQGFGAVVGRLPAHSQRDRRSAVTTAAPEGALVLPKHVQTQGILVTLAERPHPFPSRTRKLSSPAPKILRGQPFGKIGRRQDFCVSGATSCPAGTGTSAARARGGYPASHE